MAVELRKIDTEQRNPRTMHIDTLSTLEMVKLINDEDHRVAEAVAQVLPEIARAVALAKKRGKRIETTTQLKEIIEEALSFIPEKERGEAVKKSCARTFQALRIDINSEYEVLYQFLEKLPGVLKSGGRAAILTFHSGEDRLGKRSFKEFKRAGIYSEIAEDVIRPSKEECAQNSRARSTKMRWAVKA